MQQPSNLYFYHSGCHDGRMAAAIALDATVDSLAAPINYDSNDIPPAEYVSHLVDKAAKHDITMNPLVSVAFLDFCPRPAQVLAMYEAGYDVLILDHHVSAREAMLDACIGSVDDPVTVIPNKSDNIGASVMYHYSEEESGALMTFKYFHPHATVPDYVKWVSDRDLWKFEYKESKPFAAGMNRYMSVQPGMLLNLLTPEGVMDMLSAGESLLQAQDAYVAKQLRNKITRIYVDGPTGLAMVAAALYNNTYLPSELADAYFKSQHEADIFISYTVVDASRVIYSVRSREGVDSLWLSERFGGGGHANANGFTTRLEELLDFLLEGEMWTN